MGGALRFLEKLSLEMKKDEQETNRVKQKQINEILSLDKSKMFEIPPKKKTSFLTKLKVILGYGKEG